MVSRYNQNKIEEIIRDYKKFTSGKITEAIKENSVRAQGSQPQITEKTCDWIDNKA